MEAIKHIINLIIDPKIVLPFIILIFFFIFPPTEKLFAINQKYRLNKIWTKQGGIVLFTTLLFFFLFGLSDENFRKIVSKPDNVPIVALIFLVAFFLWFSLKQAFEN